jgi:putative glutamine amidotransferase
VIEQASMTSRSPIVGIPCDHRLLGHHPFHLAGEKYISAVRDGAGVMPVLLPVLDPPIAVAEILDAVDGLLMTGSPSNVAPRHYGGSTPRDGVLQDENRDATSLPLIRAAIAAGMPLLCICRGFQELNVALGGSLHQHVHEVAGRLDHREAKDASLDAMYGPAHEVQVASTGLLASIVGARMVRVNSLHSQGVDRLASELHADATAPDGQIEAVSMPKAKSFLLGLQWHPEWRWSEDTVSRAIFRSFGSAVSARRAKSATA